MGIIELVDRPETLTEEDFALILRLDAENKGFLPYNCPKCETENFLQVGHNHCVNCNQYISRLKV